MHNWWVKIQNLFLNLTKQREKTKDYPYLYGMKWLADIKIWVLLAIMACCDVSAQSYKRKQVILPVEVYQGDTLPVIHLRDVYIYRRPKFKNQRKEKFYWRTVRDVRKALPYAHLICETLLETYEYIETFPTQEEREAHINSMEGALFKQYKPALKKFTRSQAKVLVKLIRRETNQSSYDIVKAFLGGFRAGFWQMFGKMFGVSLKGSFEPNKNREDAIIERIACLIEDGLL